MKSKIILSGIAAILTSVAGANALEYRPFVGVSMGMQSMIYSDDVKDLERAAGIDFPSDFFAFGIDGGVRFGAYNEIYNGGLTVSATKTTYSKVQQKYTDTRVASADAFDMSVSYDNYIRISGDKTSRIDLVLGAGLGAYTYHLDPVMGDSETRWSFAPELKVGMDFELTQNITLSANGRAIIPTRSDYAMDMSYIFGGTVKYLF